MSGWLNIRLQLRVAIGNSQKKKGLFLAKNRKRDKQT